MVERAGLLAQTFEMRRVLSLDVVQPLAVRVHTRRGFGVRNTYLLGGDHDTDLLDSLGEFIGLNRAGVVQVEVLERLGEHLLFRSNARCLLLQLVLQFSLETI